MDSSDSSSSTNSISCNVEYLEALKTLKDLEIGDKTFKKMESTNTIVMNEKEGDTSDESTFQQFIDYLAAEEKKLPDKAHTCFDKLLKLYIAWAKKLDKSIPNVQARLQLMAFSKKSIERINVFRKKVSAGKYRHEPSQKYLRDVVDEFQSFKALLNVQIIKSGDSASSSNSHDVRTQSTQSREKCEYDADNEDSSDSSKEMKAPKTSVEGDEETLSTSEEETMPTLEEETVPASEEETMPTLEEETVLASEEEIMPTSEAETTPIVEEEAWEEKAIPILEKDMTPSLEAGTTSTWAEVSTFEQPSHEQFLLFLTTVENELPNPTTTIFDEGLKLLVEWSRRLENDLEKNIFKYHSVEFRSKFIKFVQEAVGDINLLRQLPQYCDQYLLECVLENICTQFKNFRTIMILEILTFGGNESEEIQQP